MLVVIKGRKRDHGRVCRASFAAFQFNAANIEIFPLNKHSPFSLRQRFDLKKISSINPLLFTLRYLCAFTYKSLEQQQLYCFDKTTLVLFINSQ